MNKKILVASAVILTIVFFLYYVTIHGWLTFRKNTDTPKEFVSHTVINKDDYAKDSATALHQLRELLVKHEEFFDNNAYFDSTEIIIDTIVYSQAYNKLGILILVKNPVYRQLVPNRTEGWYYDATAYIGIRRNATISLSWIGPIFTNSGREEDMSKIIRDACFRKFATKEGGLYEFNLNDIRFWNGPIWKTIEVNQQRKKELEREIKEHPEDVSTPKK